MLLAGGGFCLGLWAVCVGLLWAAEPELVFMPGNSRAYISPLDPAIFRQGAFVNHDGLTLRTVSLRHASPADGFWIFFCPPAGASTKVIWTQEQLKQLWTLGYNVFAFDYRGFGESEGTPTEQGVYEDAAAAFEQLTRVNRVPASRVVLAGRSLGSAVAVDLALKVDSAGLLLFSPIDSVPSVGARLYPWAPVRLLAQHQFDNMAKARAVDVPVVMFYGWPDSFVRRQNARALFNQFRGPKLLIETGGGHLSAGFVDVSRLYRALNTYWPVKNKG